MILSYLDNIILSTILNKTRQRVAQMKNRVRRMVEDDESLKYAEYTDHSITKVGIPPPVLSQHQSKLLQVI